MMVLHGTTAFSKKCSCAECSLFAMPSVIMLGASFYRHAELSIVILGVIFFIVVLSVVMLRATCFIVKQSLCMGGVIFLIDMLSVIVLTVVCLMLSVVMLLMTFYIAMLSVECSVAVFIVSLC
jgi:hypothetical protein